MSARHDSTVPNDLPGGYSWDGEISAWSDQPINKEQHFSSSAEPRVQVMNEPARATRKVNSRRKGRRKDASIIAAICAWIVEHQIGLATNLLSLLVLTHLCFPRSRRQTRKFFGLSYYNASSGQYTLGWDDIFLVFYWIVIFTGLRAAVMDYLLAPLAQRAGIGKKKEMVRFAEQAWIFIYYGGCWSLGMYLLYNSDYWLNLRQLWVGWPNREMSGLSKWYYLVQFAFWLQQILVVNIEERRKDYLQMFTHHVITCALIFTSYGYHQTKVGNLILCLMDVVDIVLPLAKMLKYMRYQVACDIAFVVFMVTWFVTRHVFYSLVCYSVYKDIPKEITYGCYYGSNAHLHGPIEPPDSFAHLIQPFRDPEGLVCWSNGIKWAFLGMLLSLQVILLLWFGMILRVAWKVVQGGEAEDSRSDDEGDYSDEEVDHHEGDEQRLKGQHACTILDSPPLEEEVGVESINLCGQRPMSPTRRYRKAVGSTTGVKLPGHSDRKELLGRIGCDKGA